MNACLEKTPAGQKTASGIFFGSYGQCTGKNGLQTTDSRRVAGQAPTKTVSGRPKASIYDPLVKYLEIGVSVNGVKAWKVNTIDTNERYGGMQGAGGLEATIMDATGATTGVLNDYQGNGVAIISGGTVTWNPAHAGVYGFLPGNAAPQLTDATQLAQVTVWKDHRTDPTGFVYFGTRIYDTLTQRWLSADPLGFAASTSLYEFCADDPLNFFDPDGRAPQGTYGFNGQGQLVFRPAPNLGPPVIECHGVSAGGFSGNINGFQGLTTIPNVSPLAADAYQGMANNIQQYGPSTLGKIGLAETGIVTGLAGGGALAGLYEAGSLGSGAFGTTVYVGLNAGLGSGISAGSNAVTQLIDTGTINTADVKFSAKLGAVFGGLSGGLGVWETSIEANAAQQEARSAFTLSTGRYLDVTEPELDAADAWAFQTAANASALTGAIWWGDTFGSPVVEGQVEDWLKAKLGIGEDPSGGNRKGCGN